MADELLKNVPPNNLEAEMAVLGALLIDEKAIDYVVQEISPEDFYRPVHTALYETMVELNRRGEPIDAVTLVTELRRRGTLETVGGPEAVSKLTSVVPTSANAVYYAKIVRDRALLRKTLTSLSESQREIFESRDQTPELLDRIEKRLFEVTQKRVKSEATDIATVLKQTFAQLEARKAGTDDTIKYGYPSLDDLTHGLHKGDMIIIAARPSMGKCVSAETEVVLEDGSVATIEEVVSRRTGRVLTLDEKYRLGFAAPSVFVDDGMKPVFRVTTRLGRVVETTAIHPFLTVKGWRPLAELAPGVEVAVPREIPVFGDRELGGEEIEALARSLEGSIPPSVFTLPRAELALFLDRVFVGKRSLATSSERLARQVQHLLLRFGIVSRLLRPRRPAFQVELEDARSLAILHVEAEALLVGAVRRGARRLSRGVSHERATSDILWDPIVSIEPLGEKQVYDLTIPVTHNFVANDVCVHNTTFALNLLRNVAVGKPGAPAGHGAVFFSLEMPKTQIVSNLLCSMAKVDSHRLRGGFLNREEEQNLLDWGEVLEKQPIYIDDTPGISVMELRGKARRLRAEGKVECILIDYLQLMQGDLGSSQKARHEVVAEISRSLKALARELEVPLIALAQLNRNVEDRPDHRPRMADLRESGSIEQDADVVMLLHRDEYYLTKEKAEEEQKVNKAQVLVQKNRNGPIGDIELYYAKEYSYFGELQR
jgi:replicative DNA helicase